MTAHPFSFTCTPACECGGPAAMIRESKVVCASCQKAYQILSIVEPLDPQYRKHTRDLKDQIRILKDNAEGYVEKLRHYQSILNHVAHILREELPPRHESGGWNIRKVGGGVAVCMARHEPSKPCVWKVFKSTGRKKRSST